MKILFFLVGLFAATSTTALAALPECKLMIDRTVVDDVGNTWQPGKILPVDIERDDPNGVSYCAHGGSCIPAKAQAGLAAHLIDCRKGAALGGGDFGLVHRRHAAPAT